jgi:hypothetical protein
MEDDNNNDDLVASWLLLGGEEEEEENNAGASLTRPVKSARARADSKDDNNNHHGKKPMLVPPPLCSEEAATFSPDTITTTTMYNTLAQGVPLMIMNWLDFISVMRLSCVSKEWRAGVVDWLRLSNSSIVSTTLTRAADDLPIRMEDALTKTSVQVDQYGRVSTRSVFDTLSIVGVNRYTNKLLGLSSPNDPIAIAGPCLNLFTAFERLQALIDIGRHYDATFLFRAANQLGTYLTVLNFHVTLNAARLYPRVLNRLEEIQSHDLIHPLTLALGTQHLRDDAAGHNGVSLFFTTNDPLWRMAKQFDAFNMMFFSTQIASLEHVTNNNCYLTCCGRAYHRMPAPVPQAPVVVPYLQHWDTLDYDSRHYVLCHVPYMAALWRPATLGWLLCEIARRGGAVDWCDDLLEGAVVLDQRYQLPGSSLPDLRKTRTECVAHFSSHCYFTVGCLVLLDSHAQRRGTSVPSLMSAVSAVTRKLLGHEDDGSRFNRRAESGDPTMFSTLLATILDHAQQRGVMMLNTQQMEDFDLFLQLLLHRQSGGGGGSKAKSKTNSDQVDATRWCGYEKIIRTKSKTPHASVFSVLSKELNVGAWGLKIVAPTPRKTCMTTLVKSIHLLSHHRVTALLHLPDVKSARGINEKQLGEALSGLFRTDMDPRLDQDVLERTMQVWALYVRCQKSLVAAGQDCSGSQFISLLAMAVMNATPSFTLKLFERLVGAAPCFRVDQLLIHALRFGNNNNNAPSSSSSSSTPLQIGESLAHTLVHAKRFTSFSASSSSSSSSSSWSSPYTPSLSTSTPANGLLFPLILHGIDMAQVMPLCMAAYVHRIDSVSILALMAIRCATSLDINSGRAWARLVLYLLLHYQIAPSMIIVRLHECWGIRVIESLNDHFPHIAPVVLKTFSSSSSSSSSLDTSSRAYVGELARAGIADRKIVNVRMVFRNSDGIIADNDDDNDAAAAAAAAARYDNVNSMVECSSYQLVSTDPTTSQLPAAKTVLSLLQ